MKKFVYMMHGTFNKIYSTQKQAKYAYKMNKLIALYGTLKQVK